MGSDMVVRIIIWLVILVLFLAGSWKVYEKAGKPGWTGIIPIYNWYVLTQILGKPIVWFFLCFLFIPLLFLAAELAVCFGKSKAWGVFLLGFFGFIGFPILGFGDAKFTPPSSR